MEPHSTQGDSTYTIRASSFGSLFDCALRWEAQHINGLSMPNSPRALLGTAFHAGTAAFDKGRIDGSGLTVDDASGAALDAMRERIAAEGVRWYADDPSQRQVEALAVGMTARYCTAVSPLHNWEAVELTTKPLEVEAGGITIRLTGTLDRARVKAGSHGIWDIKSGRAAVSKGRAVVGKHRAQLGTYELLYEHTTGIPINGPSGILGMNTSGRHEHAATEVEGAKRLLVGTVDTPGLIELAADTLRSGLFRPNPQSNLCSARYCVNWWRCPYADK